MQCADYSTIPLALPTVKASFYYSVLAIACLSKARQMANKNCNKTVLWKKMALLMVISVKLKNTKQSMYQYTAQLVHICL